MQLGQQRHEGSQQLASTHEILILSLLVVTILLPALVLPLALLVRLRLCLLLSFLARLLLVVRPHRRYREWHAVGV